MSEIVSDGFVTARKPHRCDQCGKHINAGERYRKQVYKDGDLYTYAAHKDCDAAANALARLAELYPDEFIILMNDATHEDGEFLWAEFPSVADRLGFTSFSFAHRFVYRRRRFW